MSNRITFAVVTVAVLGGGAVLWQMHNQKEISRASAAVTVAAPAPAVRTEERKENEAGEPREMAAPATEATRRPVDTKKSAVAADAGSPLRAGETWQYSAIVSKLSSVANLRLKVAGKRHFLGKKAWHLQAFAHTENPFRMVFALDDQFDSYSDAATLVSMQYRS